MKVAYADPPYIGQAYSHYRYHQDYGGEVDHEALIARLSFEFPDGWALSCSSKSLQEILRMSPEDVRVHAWIKNLHTFLPGIRVQYAWEPVIIRGGRQVPHVPGTTTLRDWVKCNPDMYTFRDKPKNHVIGKKPEGFCFWLFEILGLTADDDFVDLFPGTGSVSKAWEQWRAQGDLFRPIHRTCQDMLWSE